VTVQRIDAAWAAFFGLTTSAFLLPGIQVVAHHQLKDYRGVWLFRHHDSLCVSVPPDSVGDAWAAVRRSTVEDLFSEAGIRALLGSRTERIVGPAYQGYVEYGRFRVAPQPGVRALAPTDHKALERLAAACAGEAWEHSGIALDEPNVFGYFVDDHLVAAARYRLEWDEAAHVGVVTHPAYRGRGYGRAVVRSTPARALAAGFIVLYQTLLANTASVALATGLGYRQYATPGRALDVGGCRSTMVIDEVTIERLRALPLDGFDPLIVESEEAGLGLVGRLVDEWGRGANRFDRPGEALFAARVGGQLVGVCGLNVDPYAGEGSVGRVRHLYVLSAYRRLGVGQRLVAEVIEAARGRFARLHLRTANPAAARLYERLGFRGASGRSDCSHVMELR
jgi:ribosomal protein S18 acetylase RimI-like enzyme